MATSLSDAMVTDVVFPLCPVMIGSKEMMADLIRSDVMVVDVILVRY